MTIGELGSNVTIGLLTIISIVTFITIIVNILHKTPMKNNPENIFLGKLNNDNTSEDAEDAVHFLALTNRINTHRKR